MSSTPAAAEPRTGAAERMWAAYAEARPEAVRTGPEHTVDRFGDSAELCEELTALVLAGTQRTRAAVGRRWDESSPIVLERLRVVRPPEVADPEPPGQGARAGADRGAPPAT